MPFDLDNPFERLLAWVVTACAGLDRLLHRLTGGSSPRNALVLLAVSVSADLYGTWAEHATLWHARIIDPVLWVAVVVPCALLLDRWVRSGRDTVPRFVDRMIAVSAFFVVLVPVQLALLAAQGGLADEVVLAAQLWESGMDLALLGVAWNLTPPGRSVLSRLAERVALSSAKPVPVRERGRDTDR